MRVTLRQSSSHERKELMRLRRPTTKCLSNNRFEHNLVILDKRAVFAMLHVDGVVFASGEGGNARARDYIGTQRIGHGEISGERLVTNEIRNSNVGRLQTTVTQHASRLLERLQQRGFALAIDQISEAIVANGDIAMGVATHSMVAVNVELLVTILRRALDRCGKNRTAQAVGYCDVEFGAVHHRPNRLIRQREEEGTRFRTRGGEEACLMQWGEGGEERLELTGVDRVRELALAM